MRLFLCLFLLAVAPVNLTDDDDDDEKDPLPSPTFYSSNSEVVDEKKSEKRSNSVPDNQNGNLQKEPRPDKETDSNLRDSNSAEKPSEIVQRASESKQKSGIEGKGDGKDRSGEDESVGQDTKESEEQEMDKQDTKGEQEADGQDQTGDQETDEKDAKRLVKQSPEEDGTSSATEKVCTADNNNGECKKTVIFPPEEDEPEYDMYIEGVDLIYSINPLDKSRGYDILGEAAEMGNMRALEMIAYGYIFGSELEQNFTRAFEIFSELAEKGHPIGQQGLGFMYSAGIGVNSNQAKALVHYVFAALGGHQFAQMAMGYRISMGVSVVQGCEGALAYYQKSAEEVIKKASLISGGIAVSKVRLIDEDDEVPNIYGVSEDEIVHYQSIFTDSGNTNAQFMLGLYYMFGMAGAQRSFKMALKFLTQASKDRFPAAHVMMGKIYAEGSSEVPQDFDLAYKHFKIAADMKHGDGYSGLGMLNYNGFGRKKDKHKALELFYKAADRGSAEGQYYLGKIYFVGDGIRRDVGKGIQYFQLASHGGHIHALYSLGRINADGSGIKRNCNFAMELFKTVSERAKFTRMFTEAQQLYNLGNVESSFMMYLLLAEMGFEVAQSNVAYLLEQGYLTFISEHEQLKRGLLFWNRAAAQGYSQARVKLGDYYYYGMGTEVSYDAAATQYRMASDKLGTPQAMFNLAYMYEHGEGVDQDYHLAKRYYDLAAGTSSEAIVPVNLALLKLNMVYMLSYYKDWLDLQSFIGGQWDIYLISILIGCVIILILWRTRH